MIPMTKARGDDRRCQGGAMVIAPRSAPNSSMTADRRNLCPRLRKIELRLFFLILQKSSEVNLLKELRRDDTNKYNLSPLNLQSKRSSGQIGSLCFLCRKSRGFLIIWLHDVPGCDIRVSGFSLTVGPFLGWEVRVFIAVAARLVFPGDV